MGKGSYDVLRRAEESEVINRLASMTAENFAEGLMAGTLGNPGESLDPLARTIFTLSLAHIPAGFEKVQLVVEHVKRALRTHVRTLFINGKSAEETTTTLMHKINYESKEVIKFFEAIRIGHCGIGVTGTEKANPRAAVTEIRAAQLIDGSSISTTEYDMPTTALAVQPDATGLASYRPLFGGQVRDATADAEVLQFAKKWYDAVHGTTSGLANFHEAVKDALKIVPFDDLKYAMFKAEHTNMIAKAQARLGRTADPGDCYSVTPAADGPAAGPPRLVLSAVLQTLKVEVHQLVLNRQKVGELAAEMEDQIAERVQAQVQEYMAKSGTTTPTPKGSGPSTDSQRFTALKKETKDMKRQLDNLQQQAKKARTGKQQNLSRKVDTDGGDTDQGAGEGPTVKFQRKSTKRGSGQRLDSEGNKKARPTESDGIAALEEKVNDDDQIDKVEIGEFFQAGIAARVLYEALNGFQEGKHADADCLSGLLFYPAKGACKNQRCKKEHNTDYLMDKSDRREVLLSALKIAAQGQVV